MTSISDVRMINAVAGVLQGISLDASERLRILAAQSGDAEDTEHYTWVRGYTREFAERLHEVAQTITAGDDKRARSVRAILFDSLNDPKIRVQKCYEDRKDLWRHVKGILRTIGRLSKSPFFWTEEVMRQARPQQRLRTSEKKSHGKRR